MARRVYLVGYMGCGKSTLGKELSKRLGWSFADTDSMMEAETGMSVSDIFASRGEDWFRSLESGTIDKVSESSTDVVIALGGGAVCRPGVMERINRAGQSIYIKLSPSKIVERVDENGRNKRPKIRGMNDAELLDYINKTLPEREKYYNNATFVIESDHLSDGAIVEEMERSIRESKY